MRSACTAPEKIPAAQQMMPPEKIPAAQQMMPPKRIPAVQQIYVAHTAAAIATL